MTAITIQRGYIVSQRSDLIWFVLMPMFAVSIALASERFVPEMALAVAAWGITVPHHFVTWLRVYGSPSEFNRFPRRFIIMPLLFIPLGFGLLKWAEIGLLTLVFLWDNQHSIMQQYGFGRVYDFKAQSGDEKTARWDYYLHWVLFVNMLVVSPVFAQRWPGMLGAWGVGVTSEIVSTVFAVSWTITAIYVVAYAAHVTQRIRSGGAINPAKFEFLAASYFLWYFAAFSTDSVLVWSIAHRLMHGGQYIIMTYYYNHNTVTRTGGDSSISKYLGVIKPANIAVFIAMGLGYSLLFRQLSIERNISEDFDLLAASLISSFSLLHYYYDSFIWKVRRPEVKASL